MFKSWPGNYLRENAILFKTLTRKDLRRIWRGSFFIVRVFCERFVSAVGFAHGLRRWSMLTSDSYHVDSLQAITGVDQWRG